MPQIDQSHRPENVERRCRALLRPVEAGVMCVGGLWAGGRSRKWRKMTSLGTEALQTWTRKADHPDHTLSIALLDVHLTAVTVIVKADYGRQVCTV